MFEFVNQMSVVLMVHCAQILFFIGAGGICANHPGDNLVITNKPHKSLAPQAQIVAT